MASLWGRARGRLWRGRGEQGRALPKQEHPLGRCPPCRSSGAGDVGVVSCPCLGQQFQVLSFLSATSSTVALGLELAKDFFACLSKITFLVSSSEQALWRPCLVFCRFSQHVTAEPELRPRAGGPHPAGQSPPAAASLARPGGGNASHTLRGCGVNRRSVLLRDVGKLCEM